NRDADVPRTHRVTRVSLAGNEYVVDVGFGSLCSRAPLLLDSDEPQDQGDAVYRIIEPDAGQYVLQMEKDGGWSTLYTFDRNLYTEADCLCGHHYSSTYPDAVFVNNLVVTLKSDGDIRSLRNGSFHHTAGGVNTITSISSSAELGRILAQEFGIELAPDQLSMLYEGYCE
ncbi:MAG: arylamine N-acetyltransferase, partial [Victivallales bacterium]|nr:arylamine N-acetyltransferase [Victivallales bacterium]